MPLLGIPYMGSKRKLAKPILDFILYKNPKTKYFYDLFGGGGAVTFEALNRPQIEMVFYNDINTGVVSLLKDVLQNGVNEKYYNFIDRDTFIKNKNGDGCFSGLCKTIWSFGNNQNTYLYNKEIETYKKLYHDMIFLGLDTTNEMQNFSEMYVYNKYGISEKCIINIPTSKTHKERYVEIKKHLLIYEQKCKIKQKSIPRLQSLQLLEHLERLEHLYRLEHLERLEHLKISNNDYRDIHIETPIDETIIYIDPPYENTEKYQNDISHIELFNWVKNSKYKVYISSYNIEGLNECLNLNHRSKFSHNKNNKTSEKLFCNF